MESNNGTLQNSLLLTTPQTVILGLYCTLVTIFGILGNSTVVYSSIRYNSIKLDSISLLFIQHLAVADLLYVIIMVLPITTTLMAGRYVLGAGYCLLSAHFVTYPGTVNSLIVLSISSYRARMITSPLSSVSKTHALILLSVIWVVGYAGTVITLAFGSSAACISSSFTFESAAARQLPTATIGILIFLPLMAISVLNPIQVVAIKNSRRFGKFPNYWGSVTVYCISGLFLISWFPYVVHTLCKSVGIQTHPALQLIAYYSNFLNTFCNPILYTLTNRRFGRFVKGLISSVICCTYFWKSDPKRRSNLKMTSTSHDAKDS